MSPDDHPGDLPKGAQDRLDDPPEPREARREIEDVDNLNTRRSLERLQHRRDLVSEAGDRLIQAQLESPYARQQAAQMYRQALVTAIAEFRPWLASDDLDLDRDYWDGVTLGTHTEQPPDVLVDGAESVPLGSPIRVAEPATESSVRFIGLRDIWDAPEAIPFEFSAELTTPVRRSRIAAKIDAPNASVQGEGSERTRTARVVVHRHIPVSVLHEASAALAEFSRQVGIDAALADENDLAQYS